MRFDDKSLAVLKNFSTINPGIRFEQGKVLRTMSPNKTILAIANVDTAIEKTFIIGDLNRFMAAMSLFNDPEISLGDNSCIIRDETNHLEYVYAMPKQVKVPPDGEVDMSDIRVQFTLTTEMMQTIKKGMSILGVGEMAVVGKNKVLSLRAFDSRGIVSDNYVINIGQTKKDFMAVFRAENLKLLPFDYEVKISGEGFAEFCNPEVRYWIAIETEHSEL